MKCVRMSMTCEVCVHGLNLCEALTKIAIRYMDTCNVADILARYSKPRIKEPQDFSCPKTLKVVSVTFHAPLDLTIHDSQGMYDPGAEHDACGVGMVTTLNKRPERKIVDDAIEVLVNLNHRGAVGARRTRATAQAFS